MDEAAATPVDLLFRHILRARLERTFLAGARVIDIGCGDGTDALLLAARGVRVVGIDAEAERVARARARAAAQGIAADCCRFEVLRAEEAARTGAGFDGAYASFGALDTADLRAVGSALAAALRPGGRLLLCVLGPWPLPAVLRRALTGVGEPRRRLVRPRGSGLPAPATVAEARRALGPRFVWTDVFALGVLLPGPDQDEWVRDHPQAFGMLAALERAVRGWPGLRQLGDRVVLEGELSGAP